MARRPWRTRRSMRWPLRWPHSHRDHPPRGKEIGRKDQGALVIQLPHGGVIGHGKPHQQIGIICFVENVGQVTRDTRQCGCRPLATSTCRLGQRRKMDDPIWPGQALGCAASVRHLHSCSYAPNNPTTRERSPTWPMPDILARARLHYRKRRISVKTQPQALRTCYDPVMPREPKHLRALERRPWQKPGVPGWSARRALEHENT